MLSIEKNMLSIGKSRAVVKETKTHLVIAGNDKWFTSFIYCLHPETIYCKVFQKGESGEGLKLNFTVIGVFSASVAEIE